MRDGLFLNLVFFLLQVAVAGAGLVVAIAAVAFFFVAMAIRTAGALFVVVHIIK